MYGLTPMMEEMLLSLAKYKYLTVSHILKLGISKSKSKSRKYFLELKKQGLVNRQIHNSVSENAKKKGFLQRTRNEYLRYLTRQGSSFLLARTNLKTTEIRFPKRPSQRLKNDYFHRVSTIFINISFDNWLQKIEGEERKFLVYYDNDKLKSKRNFEAQTRLELGLNNHYTPDAICGFKKDNQPKVFCIEVYNNDKLGYIENQLVLLFWILDRTRKIEEKIGWDTIPQILVTFDSQATLSKILARLNKQPIFHVEGVEELILFNLDTNVWEDFGNGWLNILGNKVNLNGFLC